MKIINKSILFTKDNWESTSTAIGEYHYTDSSGNILETYGINAETLIGMLIIGEQLILRNSNGAMTFDDSGLTIDTKANGGYAYFYTDGKQGYIKQGKSITLKKGETCL